MSNNQTLWFAVCIQISCLLYKWFPINYWLGSSTHCNTNRCQWKLFDWEISIMHGLFFHVLCLSVLCLSHSFPTVGKSKKQIRQNSGQKTIQTKQWTKPLKLVYYYKSQEFCQKHTTEKATENWKLNHN